MDSILSALYAGPSKAYAHCFAGADSKFWNLSWLSAAMSALTDMRDLICAAVSLAQVATSALVCDAILGSVFGTEDGHGVSLSVFAGERRRIGIALTDRPSRACVRRACPARSDSGGSEIWHGPDVDALRFRPVRRAP